jgi:hypothetical protein
MGRADGNGPDGGDRPTPLRQEGRACGRWRWRNPTRELLDTLLLWKPDVVLDGNGMALIEVPLNDA